MLALGRDHRRIEAPGEGQAPLDNQAVQLDRIDQGFVIAGIKELTAAKVGDTVTHAAKAAPEPLPGFKEVKPQVFAGL
ncbi:hypothetical protein F3J18_36240, partial [Burkholderia sp. Ax-1720]|uniref:hypothetical protein n=1 Tax=Burkholderia sp. Ax-1720 TaxID=2608335 RepID=UPI0014223362